MTIEKFIENVQNYYGDNYDENLLTFVFGYLKTDHTERDLSKLFRYTLKVHALNWGLPDIHALDEAWKRRNEDRKWETTEASAILDYSDPREDQENVRRVHEILQSAKWNALKNQEGKA